MKSRMVWLLAAMVSVLCAAGVQADEVADLKKQVTKQEKQISDLKQKVDRIETAKKAEAKPVSGEDKKADAKKDSGLPDSLKWAQNISWFGDIRLRYDRLEKEGSPDRDRNRFRLRAGLAAKVNDEWDASMRLTTDEGWEGGDPVSGNQSMDGAFSKKQIWLDMAYVQYHPKAVQGLNVVAGKMEMPFYKAGKNQLIWDVDLTLEGGAINYTHSLSKQTKVTVTGGGFWIAENAADLDPALFGLQGYLQQGLSGGSSLIGGASYYSFMHIKNYSALNKEWNSTAANNWFGNNRTAGNRFASDYDVLEIFGEFSTKVGKLPVSAFGSYVINTTIAEGLNEDTGWLIGVKLNKAAAPRSWELGYDYRDVGADALVGQFNENESYGGGTDGKGHKVNFVYQVAKNVQAGLTYYAQQLTRPPADLNYNRIQADVMVRFK